MPGTWSKQCAVHTYTPVHSVRQRDQPVQRPRDQDNIVIRMKVGSLGPGGLVRNLKVVLMGNPLEGFI